MFLFLLTSSHLSPMSCCKILSISIIINYVDNKKLIKTELPKKSLQKLIKDTHTLKLCFLVTNSVTNNSTVLPWGVL